MIEQLIYSSHATEPFNAETLDSLLEVARANNQDAKVTGFLLYDGEGFVQLLEGDTYRVNVLYEKISTDSRHKDVHLMIRQSAAQSAFSNWSMSYAIVEPGGLRSFGGTISRESINELIGCIRDSNSVVRQLISDFLNALRL